MVSSLDNKSYKDEIGRRFMVAPDSLSLLSLLKARWVHPRLIHRAFCGCFSWHYDAWSGSALS